ncbi:MAG: amino acid adenylation domain-containing protein, partial [Candidatus Tectomicrobia bacterium]
RTLLAGMATNHAQRIADVPLLTEEERHLILVEWNDTQVDYPRDWCIHHLFDHQTEQTPNSIAVAFLEEKLTYAELNRRANQLAHYLQSLGVGPEVCVGVCMERSIDMIVGIFAVLKAGGAYVPIDPNYPEERLSVILENTQAPVLLTLQSSLDTRHALLVNHPCQAVCLDTAWERIAGEPETNPVSEVTPQNLAYAIYTSGSTGQPKGVQVTHQNLVHSTYARLHYYPEPPTRFLLLSSFAFDSSVAGIFWTLCQGGALILPQERLEQDIEQLGSLIAEHRISHMLTLPSLYNLLLEHVAPHKLQSLQIVMVAGEACPKEAVLRHHMLMPNTTLYNEYGPTEGTVWCTAYQIPTNVAGSQIPIGRPIANMRVYLLDAHGQPVPIGVPGELYIGGDGLARGYLHRPDLTDERFVRPAFSDVGTRLYRTGDLARYLPDGNIEFLGRIDHQIKIRGYRVELEEIEAVLAQHPAVRETVVVAREEARIPAGRTNHEETEALAGQLSAMDEKTADDLLAAIERLSAEAVEIFLAHGV